MESTKYDRQLHKTYIDKCIHNILCLEYSDKLLIDIIYIIINFYWNFRSEPVCVIFANSEYALYTYTYRMIIDQLKQIHPRCHYFVKNLPTDEIVLQSGCQGNVRSGFIFSRCVLLPGYKWNLLVRLGSTDIFSPCSDLSKYIEGRSHQTPENNVLSWINHTFNNDQFLNEQNDII